MVQIRVRAISGLDTYRTVWLQPATILTGEHIKGAARGMLALRNPKHPAATWRIVAIDTYPLCPITTHHGHGCEH